MKIGQTNVAMERVKSFVDRLERREEERQALGGDIRDIYAEAKGVGFDVKTLRWLVSERKVESSDRAERDALRATYANALGLAVELVEVNGLSLRQAAKRAGVSKSSIQRALAVPDVSQPAPHDADGVITETEIAAPQGSSPGIPQAVGVAAPAVTPAPDGGGGVGTHTEKYFARFTDDDMPAIPPFLRRAARTGT